MTSYIDFIEWCKLKEPDAFQRFEVSCILEDIFNERYETDIIFSRYLKPLSFRKYLYSDVLHTFITQSDSSETEFLKSLYSKYGIGGGENMLLTSVGDSGTSASKFIPSIMHEGDLMTMDYYQTPYGRYVEAINEQLANIVL